jgi:hypothetical protein
VVQVQQAPPTTLVVVVEIGAQPELTVKVLADNLVQVVSL